MSIALRLQPLVQDPEVPPEVLPVLFLRDAIHPHRRVLAGTAIGAHQGRHIDEVCQRVEPSFGFPSRSFHYLQEF